MNHLTTLKEMLAEHTRLIDHFKGVGNKKALENLERERDGLKVAIQTLEMVEANRNATEEVYEMALSRASEFEPSPSEAISTAVDLGYRKGCEDMARCVNCGHEKELHSRAFCYYDSGKGLCSCTSFTPEAPESGEGERYWEGGEAWKDAEDSLMVFVHRGDFKTRSMIRRAFKMGFDAGYKISPEPLCDCGGCNTCLHEWNNYPTTYGESK